MIDEHITVEPRPLSPQQAEWLERAWAQIDPAALGQLDSELVSIPSPTGQERQVNQYITRHLRDAGLEATYQAIDEEQGNAVGKIRGSGEGADLLLYAPIDTAFTGNPEEDLPWLGADIRADLQTQGHLEG